MYYNAIKILSKYQLGKQHQLQDFDPLFGCETLGVIILTYGNNCDTIADIKYI